MMLAQMITPQYSLDGRWYWDGERWLPVGPSPAVTPYRSPRTRSRWAVAMLAVMAAVGALWLFAFGAEALLATDHQYSDPSLYTTPMLLVTALAFVLGIPTAAAVITWLFRCCRNLPALGVREIRRATPAEAIAGWFLPYVGTLFWPCLVVREAWLASDPAVPISTRTSRRGVPGVVLGWWIAYVAAVNLLSVGVYVAGSSTPRTATIGALVGMLGVLAEVVAAGLAIAMVLGITSRQDAKSRALGLADAGEHRI